MDIVPARRGNTVLVWPRRNRVWLGCVLALMCAGMLVVGSLALGPAIRAAGGEGVRGVFEAQQRSCSSKGGCIWTGTFTSGNGQVVVPDVTYEDSMPPGTHAGTVEPARYPGSNEAFAIQESTSWLQIVILMIFAIAGLAVIGWVGPLRYLRRRRGELRRDTSMS